MARLLLIEDDAATAEEVLGDLRGRGHEVAWAATGPDGATAARSGPWDAIILDRMLPAWRGSPCCATCVGPATGRRRWS